MIINFWYPMTESTNLENSPMHARILCQNFVLFRDTEGAAHCLSNVCVHRGGSLAHGKMKGDCVECSYHGWQYGGDGRCTRIPRFAPDAKIPSRVKVDSYPVQEKYGLVFVFLGDLPEEERIPIMEIEEYGQPDWRATIQHWVFDVNYRRTMENGIDPLHNEYVHPTHGYSGERDDYHTKKREPYDTEWGSAFDLGGVAPPLPDPKMREASGRTDSAYIEGGSGHHGVASIWTHIHPSPKMFIHQYLFETPIDEYQTSVYLVNLRNFLIEPEHDERMMGRNEYVAFQDRDTLGVLRPVLTPPTSTREFFIKGDDCVARYRDWLNKWEAMGWRIDTKTRKETEDEVAYAIPCPGRRTSKNWILNPIPLVPADASKLAEFNESPGKGTAGRAS